MGNSDRTMHFQWSLFAIFDFLIKRIRFLQGCKLWDYVKWIVAWNCNLQDVRFRLFDWFLHSASFLIFQLKISCNNNNNAHFPCCWRFTNNHLRTIGSILSQAIAGLNQQYKTWLMHFLKQTISLKIAFLAFSLFWQLKASILITKHFYGFMHCCATGRLKHVMRV